MIVYNSLKLQYPIISFLLCKDQKFPIKILLPFDSFLLIKKKEFIKISFFTQFLLSEIIKLM